MHYNLHYGYFYNALYIKALIQVLLNHLYDIRQLNLTHNHNFKNLTVIHFDLNNELCCSFLILNNLIHQSQRLVSVNFGSGLNPLSLKPMKETRL